MLASLYCEMQYKTVDNITKPKKPKTVAKFGGMTKLNLTEQQRSDFARLIQSGMTAEQACQSLGLAYGRARKIYEKLALQAQTSLRLSLFDALHNHVKESASAAVFAAKAKLGWQDITKIEQNQVVEYVDLPDRESREAWQKRQALRLVKPTGS